MKSTCCLRAAISLLFLLSGSALPLLAATWHVAPSGSDAADGTSWTTAKQSIQAAIDVTVSNDTVLVSNGVYAIGSRTVFSSMSNRVAITNAITVQSVNGPDVTFIVGAQDPFTPNGNASIRCVYMTLNSFLTGFTLTNGHTRTNGINGIEINGGGAYCGFSAVVSNCVFTGNSAHSGGGAFDGNFYDCIFYGNKAGSGGGSHQGEHIRCTFSNNTATLNGGGSYFDVLHMCSVSQNTAAIGGGMYGSSLYNCTVANNTASQDGGGSGQGAMTFCTVFGNTAGRGGGAFFSTLNNCTVFGNTATNGGGAYNGTLNNCVVNGNYASLYGGGCSFSVMKNCTITGNTAGDTGGGMNSGAMQDGICYFNTAPNGSNYFGSSILFSCVAPNPGNNCIAVNPNFVNAAASNFHLSASSACIDTGSNFYAVGPTDRDGNPRILNGTVDMGAFEYQYNAGFWLWASAITNGATNYSDSATGDGYANLVKYATGSSATNADDLAAIDATRATNNLFATFFNRNTNAYDVTLYVDASDSVSDGAIWTSIATNIQGMGWNSTNVTETGVGSPVSVNVTDPTTATNRFTRLRVTRP